MFSVIELGNLTEGAPAANAPQFAVEEAKRAFDLTRGPLWRVTVFRKSDEEHYIVLVMHHIVSDAWSFYIFCQELAELYDAALSGRPVRLAELPIQYADFGQRQRQWLSGPVFEQHLAHWRMHLLGNIPRLQLPTDRRPSAAMNPQGTFQTLTIPPAVHQSLGQLSRSENGTLFMTLLAGFEILLHRYSGQEDLVLCTPASGRHRSQTKELIGYFNNILPMRFDLRDNPTFVDLVRRTRRVALDAYKYQDLPFLVIADSPNLKAVSLSRVLFSVDIEWPPKLTLSGLECEAWAVRTDTADFDLTVSLWMEGEELRGVFEYKTELFDQETIAQMIADYRELLADARQRCPRWRYRLLPARTKRDAEVRLAAAEPKPTDYHPPALPTESRIVKEWEDILGIHPIGPDDDLFELGAPSLAVARLSERLQKVFQVRLSLAAIFQAKTVARIASLVRNSGSSLHGSALAPIQPLGDHPPWFLCEGLGIYYPLIRHLGQDQPVYGLVTEVARDYPKVEDLAASYIKEVRAMRPEGPYFLGGLSFGGIVAFEMAQQLCAVGQEVALLALFDTPTPWAFTPKPFLARLAGHLGNLGRFGFRYIWKRVRWRLGEIPRRLRASLGRPEESRADILADQDRLRHLFTATADQLATTCARIPAGSRSSPWPVATR